MQELNLFQEKEMSDSFFSALILCRVITGIAAF